MTMTIREAIEAALADGYRVAGGGCLTITDTGDRYGCAIGLALAGSGLPFEPEYGYVPTDTALRLLGWFGCYSGSDDHPIVAAFDNGGTSAEALAHVLDLYGDVELGGALPEEAIDAG